MNNTDQPKGQAELTEAQNEAFQWLLQNDDFEYEDINGVDVPTLESIAKIVERYAALKSNHVEEQPKEGKIKWLCNGIEVDEPLWAKLQRTAATKSEETKFSTVKISESDEFMPGDELSKFVLVDNDKSIVFSCVNYLTKPTEYELNGKSIELKDLLSKIKGLSEDRGNQSLHNKAHQFLNKRGLLSRTDEDFDNDLIRALLDFSDANIEERETGWLKLNNVKDEMPDVDCWLVDNEGKVLLSPKGEYVPFDVYEYYQPVVPPNPPTAKD